MKYSAWLVGNSIDVTELKAEGNSENWKFSIKYLILKIKGDERACDGPDVVQAKDLRDKTGDLLLDLKISSDWRGNIYALEVHTNPFFFKQ